MFKLFRVLTGCVQASLKLFKYQVLLYITACNSKEHLHWPPLNIDVYFIELCPVINWHNIPHWGFGSHCFEASTWVHFWQPLFGLPESLIYPFLKGSSEA